jgi:soluble lytic murein transglycosylase-like protein
VAQDGAAVTAEGSSAHPRGAAMARRKRMHRRQAKRRLSKVLLSATVVFALATYFRPEVPSRSAAPAPVDSTAQVPSRWLGRPLAKTAPSPLNVSPVWRPAGEILKRSKSTEVASVPWGSERKDTARHAALSRWHRIYTYSTKYRITVDLARRIYDASVTAGIEPELGFRLVRVESVFKPKALSPAGAIGLTQLMLGTARAFEPNVTREQLMDPDVNLRIGFRYLRTLIRDYKGDLKLALLVYNRGPVAVQNAISLGLNPANGYENLMLRGYRGRGTLE